MQGIKINLKKLVSTVAIFGVDNVYKTHPFPVKTIVTQTGICSTKSVGTHF